VNLVSGQVVQIKPGCGFWDVTCYPYGGCFKRCPAAPLPVRVVEVVRQYGDRVGSPREVKVEALNSPFLDAPKGKPSFFVVKIEHLEKV